MAIDKSIRDALDVKHLQLPGRLPVTSIEAEEYTDSSGEPSLRIRVMLDEAADVDKVAGNAIVELKAAIRNSLRKHDVSLFPYVFLSKPSELVSAEGD